MANTPWVDRTSQEIMSHHVSGLQGGVKNVEQALNMGTETVTEYGLTLLADADGVYRIAEAVDKRNWLTDPAPVIEQLIDSVWTTITEGFTIDHAGGALEFTAGQAGESFRASFTRVKNVSGFNTHLENYAIHGELIAFPGFYIVTEFDKPTAGDITETMKKTADNSTFLTRVTEFDKPLAGNITVTLECQELGIHNKVVTEFDTPTVDDITETASEVS